MDKKIKDVYVGLPEHLVDNILWVKRNYRTNPLSHIPGGVDVVVEYHNGENFGYDWVKYPIKYIKKLFPQMVDYYDQVFFKLSKKKQLEIAQEKIAKFYARESNNQSAFVEFWDSKTSNEMPWDSFELKFPDGKINNSVNLYSKQKKADNKQTQVKEVTKDSAQDSNINFDAAKVCCEQGIAYFEQGNLEQAIKDYTQAIKINPNYTNAYINRGLAYYKQGNLEQAIKDYTQALKINPNDANAYNNRAGAYIEQKNFENAIEDITQIIKLDPDNPDHYVRRGLTKHDNLQNNRIKYHIMRSKGEKLDEKFTNPIEDFTQAIKLNPNNPNYYVYRGVLYEEKNKFEKAIEDFTQVIHLEPNNSDHYINRGCAYYKSYKFEKAIEDFTQVIHLEPNNSDHYINRGLAYYKKNEFENAMGDFTQAIRLDPNNFKAYQGIGDIYSSQCYFRKASENFIKADEKLMKSSTRNQKHDTNNERQELVEEIAKSYKRRNTHIKHINLDQAFNYYKNLINVSSENAEAYFVRGLVQFWQEKLELALDDLNQYMSLTLEVTEDAETYFKQGVIFLVKADFRKAIKSFQKYLEFNADCSEVYFLLGVANFSNYKLGEFLNNIYCVNGQSDIKEIDEAIKNFDQALALNRNDAETYFMRGCVYKLNKNFAKAIDDLQQSIYLNSKNSECYHTLGDIFYEQEKHQEALEQYNKALTIDASNPYLYQRIGEIYKKEESIKKAVNYFQKASNLFLEKSQENNSWYRTQDMINYQKTLESINQLISELTFREKYFIFRTSEEPNFIEKDSSE